MRKLCIEPTPEEVHAKEKKADLRLLKLHEREGKLLTSERRWLRRYRVANNKLKKIRAALKRCRKAQETVLQTQYENKTSN